MRNCEIGRWGRESNEERRKRIGGKESERDTGGTAREMKKGKEEKKYAAQHQRATTKEREREWLYEECGKAGPQPAMVSRPSPFKSRCLAILNFKNGACILSARNTPFVSFFLLLRLCGLLHFQHGPASNP